MCNSNPAGSGSTTALGGVGRLVGIGVTLERRLEDDRHHHHAQQHQHGRQKLDRHQVRPDVDLAIGLVGGARRGSRRTTAATCSRRAAAAAATFAGSPASTSAAAIAERPAGAAAGAAGAGRPRPPAQVWPHQRCSGAYRCLPRRRAACTELRDRRSDMFSMSGVLSSAMDQSGPEMPPSLRMRQKCTAISTAVTNGIR